MKRDEKHNLSKQRILQAAMQEFSAKGYINASLNTVCSENGISKGIIYHYYKDKDELYLLCVSECFTALTEYLSVTCQNLMGNAEECLNQYFDIRLRFFADNPLYWGIFSDASMNPPAHLLSAIKTARQAFDTLNITILTRLLSASLLRQDVSLQAIIEWIQEYMDFFNLRYTLKLNETADLNEAILMHEQKCHRQLSFLLFGVMEH